MTTMIGDDVDDGYHGSGSLYQRHPLSGWEPTEYVLHWHLYGLQLSSRLGIHFREPRNRSHGVKGAVGWAPADGHALGKALRVYIQ